MICNVKIGTRITLNSIEQGIVKLIANKRYEVNRKHGVHNAKIGNQSDAETDIEGFGGEMAFCKLHNIFPDLLVHVQCTQHDDGDGLLHIEHGRVDVKCTKYERGRLISPTWKSKDACDMYALMVGTFPTYTFKGMITSDEFINDKRIGDIGYGKITYIATQNELLDLESIMQ